MGSVNYQELLDKIDHYKETIQHSRPLNETELRQLDGYFKIDFTYSSNALEGNTLTLSETKILLEDGITIAGKPMKDCLEATGHAKAYDEILELARAKSLRITEEQVKRLHFLFYAGIDPKNAGKYRDCQVYISGTQYLPSEAKYVPTQMQGLIREANEWMSSKHPVETAALVHKRLVDIHPFIDGNGRTARMLMNLILINQGYGVVSIPPVLRNEYIGALMISQKDKNSNVKPFLQFIAECVFETQKDYCRLLRIKPVC